MHIYKDHLNWIDIKSITNVIKVKFITVKEFRIAALGLHQFWAFVCFSYLSLLPNQFLLYITFQYPLKLLRKDWKKGLKGVKVRSQLNSGFRASSTLINFPIHQALDFPQLLDV